MFDASRAVYRHCEEAQPTKQPSGWAASSLARLAMTTVRFGRLIASGCGVGYAPFAPGTVASAIALLIGALLLHISPALLPIIAAISAVAGLWAIAATRVEDDPGWVVIDEFAGQFLALCGLTRATWPGLLAAFLIFRLLDIAKPGPIAWADRQNNPAGIMADDIIAGAIAAALLWAMRAHWPAVFD
jgi:phosphatidylglycerophosphatase A